MIIYYLSSTVNRHFISLWFLKITKTLLLNLAKTMLYVKRWSQDSLTLLLRNCPLGCIVSTNIKASMKVVI